MPTQYRTATDTQKAEIAGGVSAPIRQNTLVRVETWPQAGKSPVHAVSVCPDGERPDACAVRTIDAAPSFGDIVLYGPRMPGPLGTAVLRDDPLVVKSGVFHKAAKGEKYYACAMQDGMTGDTINTYPSDGVVP